MDPVAMLFLFGWIGIPSVQYILARRSARRARDTLAEAAAEASKPQPDPEPPQPAAPASKAAAVEKAAADDIEAVWRRLAHVPALLRARPDRWAEVQRQAAASKLRRAPSAAKQMVAAAIAEVEDLAARKAVSAEWAGRMVLRLRFIERDLED